METFQNQVIGYDGFVERPQGSPDLTPMDFFLWGHINGRSAMASTRATAKSEDVIQSTSVVVFDDESEASLNKILNFLHLASTCTATLL
ncbi:hypothetical protein AVEN_125562-1 [Araneus ventricosus]|uniref:Uncharacterized protein n=1 Tax=Araneus ventricosus TaxID=182803 RepID=A0A4Y2NFB6_ARAVE|nr:hypothetical protein AVEN_125562-1 [Araneus ventricosus]